jgi:hypothetical protein
MSNEEQNGFFAKPVLSAAASTKLQSKYKKKEKF